jgi:hypothetical protein
VEAVGTVVTARLAIRLTVGLAATMTAAGLVSGVPAGATSTAAVPAVTLNSTSADVNTSSFVGASQSTTDAPASQFLTFSANQAPPGASIGQTSALGAASQTASVNTSSAQPFPVQGLKSISVRGSSSAVVTATPGDPTVRLRLQADGSPRSSQRAARSRSCSRGPWRRPTLTSLTPARPLRSPSPDR